MPAATTPEDARRVQTARAYRVEAAIDWVPLSLVRLFGDTIVTVYEAATVKKFLRGSELKPAPVITAYERSSLERWTDDCFDIHYPKYATEIGCTQAIETGDEIVFLFVGGSYAELAAYGRHDGVFRWRGDPAQSNRLLATEWGIACVDDSGCGLVGLERRTGQVRWQTDLGASIRGLVLFNGVIVACSEDTFFGLDPDRGRELWRHQHFNASGELGFEQRGPTPTDREYLLFDERDDDGAEGWVRYAPRSGERRRILTLPESPCARICTPERVVALTEEEDGTYALRGYDWDGTPNATVPLGRFPVRTQSSCTIVPTSAPQRFAALVMGTWVCVDLDAGSVVRTDPYDSHVFRQGGDDFGVHADTVSCWASGGLVGFDLVDGSRVWSHAANPLHGDARVAGTYLVHVGESGRVTWIDPGDGRELHAIDLPFTEEDGEEPFDGTISVDEHGLCFGHADVLWCVTYGA